MNRIRKFIFQDFMTASGCIVIILLFLAAVYAPLIANGRPLFLAGNGSFSFPAFRALLSPDSPEVSVEKAFNFLMFFLPFTVLVCLFIRRKKWRTGFLLAGGLLMLLPFLFAGNKADLTDWHSKGSLENSQYVIHAPVPWGPFETEGVPYGKPSGEHWFGTDHAGRDVLARMVYGARVSVAVGAAASLISIVIGTLMGMLAGYLGGRFDLYVMRAVEIIVCFPQFLLLLILMSIMLDYGCRQSILLVIGVLGIFGWTGLCRLVRGETLKQRAMPYIAAAENLGVPTGRILLKHLLPNVAGPVLVTFAFEAAGAILAESFLSFLGFGVQDPAASWGELMRQAFPDPVTYWHLTLWPGLAIFLAVCSFNFLGEGLRKMLNR